MQQSLTITDTVLNISETVSLKEEIEPELTSLIEHIHRAFAPLSLSGPIVKRAPPRDQQVGPADRDYESQQCKLYLAQRSWEGFNLADAAFIMGNKVWVSPEVWFGALPYMFELILRAEAWLETFDRFLWLLRYHTKKPDSHIPSDLPPEIAPAIVAFLDAIEGRWEETYGYDAMGSGTLLNRTRSWWQARERK